MLVRKLLIMPSPAAYAPWLWCFTSLFALRVLGQVVVVIFHPRWLPPMEQWYSGLLPYPYLLPAQILIFALMVAIDRHVAAGSGFFARCRPRLGRWLMGLSYVYFLGMVVRYVVRMTLHPDQRWLGGTIPIVFHCVLAAYLFTYGHYHARGRRHAA
jgi:hypothetical protein